MRNLLPAAVALSWRFVFYSRPDLQQLSCSTSPLFGVAVLGRWSWAEEGTLYSSPQQQGRSVRKTSMLWHSGLICGVDCMQLNSMESGLGSAQGCGGFCVCRCPCTPFLPQREQVLGCTINTSLPFSLFLHPCKLHSLHGNAIKGFMMGMHCGAEAAALGEPPRGPCPHAPRRSPWFPRHLALPPVCFPRCGLGSGGQGNIYL